MNKARPQINLAHWSVALPGWGQVSTLMSKALRGGLDEEMSVRPNPQPIKKRENYMEW